jgi:alanine or glycine:cation symporter, AGCS family
MLQQIAAWNGWVNGFVWGWPTIVLLLGTGVLLTVLTGGVQFRYLGFALREVLGKITQKSAGPGSVSPFQAVATALASTVGVGNIAGVATAIAIGGPGALFWLWVSGVLGMCTKFAEIVIALHYREPDAKGVMRGGAMYTLRRLKLPWLGTIFAGLVSLAAFGIGNMVQANSVSDSLRATFGIAPWMTGVVLAGVTAFVIVGGLRRIGEVTEYLVPAMALFYLGGGLIILIRYATEIPTALGLVFDGAFTGTAATGGFVGSTFIMALRFGVARGLFSTKRDSAARQWCTRPSRPIIPCVRGSTASSKSSSTPSSSARRRDSSSSSPTPGTAARQAPRWQAAPSPPVCRAPGATSW